MWKCSALTNTLSLILKSGDGDQRLSAETWYRFWASELLVKLVEVHYKVASEGGDKVSFRVDGEVWVVALIGEEW